MEEKRNNKVVWIVGGIIILIIISLFLPDIMENKEELQKLRHENDLINEGKIKSKNTVIDEIVNILKNRDKEKLKEYLADDFTYKNNDNHESKYADNLWSDLDYLVEEKYDIEKRANDIKDQETYRIYWNTNSLVKERADKLYCLQKITILLKKVVKQDIITYEIQKIIITNN